jgi:hypothetical protein
MTDIRDPAPDPTLEAAYERLGTALVPPLAAHDLVADRLRRRRRRRNAVRVASGSLGVAAVSVLALGVAPGTERTAPTEPLAPAASSTDATVTDQALPPASLDPTTLPEIAEACDTSKPVVARALRDIGEGEVRQVVRGSGGQVVVEVEAEDGSFTLHVVCSPLQR